MPVTTRTQILARDILETAIPYALYKVADDIQEAKNKAFERDLALSPAEWRLLVAIGAFAPLSTKDLASHSRLGTVKVSRATDRLLRRGFVLKEVNARDKRLIIVTLSARGRTLFQQVVRAIRRWDESILVALSPQQQRGLATAIDRLQAGLASLQEAGGFAVSGSAASAPGADEAMR
jgi:DNA-binding MarR family transcriptional regulator